METVPKATGYSLTPRLYQAYEDRAALPLNTPRDPIPCSAPEGDDTQQAPFTPGPRQTCKPEMEAYIEAQRAQSLQTPPYPPAGSFS